jgi:hypothetical protein
MLPAHGTLSLFGEKPGTFLFPRVIIIQYITPVIFFQGVKVRCFVQDRKILNVIG